MISSRDDKQTLGNASEPAMCGPLDRQDTVDTALQPGDTVTISGLYRVRHYQHRLLHVVFISGGSMLPLCNRCGQRVRFEYFGAGPASLDSDVDFCLRAERQSGR